MGIVNEANHLQKSHASDHRNPSIMDLRIKLIKIAQKLQSSTHPKL